MPLFMLTAPSISASMIADVPMTLQSEDRYLSAQVSATWGTV